MGVQLLIFFWVQQFVVLWHALHIHAMHSARPDHVIRPDFVTVKIFGGE
jgi:hypothetical protein